MAQISPSRMAEHRQRIEKLRAGLEHFRELRDLAPLPWLRLHG
jgi:hypothetical protein